MPAIRDQQQPIKHAEVMGNSRHVPNAEAFASGAAECRGDEQPGSDPGKAGNSDLWKRRRPNQPTQDGEGIAVVQPAFGPKVFHARSLP